jgi:hypothetical protein
MGALAAGFLAGALGGMVRDLNSAAAEIENLARLSNATTDQFQATAYAASMVGVEQDKLADILKDVNDKVGEFIGEGSGELTNFFTNIAPKVGVTADEFARLSGPDALQLYVSSLEKAGVNQQEMISAMEAIADDATRLLPLFRNNGEAIQSLSADAREMGLILTQEAIVSAKQTEAQLKTLDLVITRAGQTMAGQMGPAVSTLSGLMIDFAKDTNGASVVGDMLSTILNIAATAGIGLATTFASLGRAIVGLAAAGMAAVTGNLSSAKNIIAEFSADNEKATAQAEARIKKLWSGGFAEDARRAVEAQKELDRVTRENTTTLARLEEQRRKAAAAAADNAAADKAAADAAAQQRAGVDRVVEGLINQAVTLSMTRKEVELYRLAMMGANEEQAESARIAIDMMEAKKNEEDNLKKMQDGNALDALLAEKQAAREAADADAAAKAHAEKIAAEQDYWNRIFDIQAGAQVSALNFADAARNMDMQGAIQHGAAMIGNLGKSSRAMFNVQKAFSLAQAAVALPTAVLESFKNGGGYPWGLVPAGLMLANGMKQIQAIKSSQFGGAPSAPSIGGGGAPTGSGLPAGATATPSGVEDNRGGPKKEIRVTFEGESIHTDAMRKFATQLAETYKDMGSNVNMVVG